MFRVSFKLRGWTLARQILISLVTFKPGGKKVIDIYMYV